MSGGAYNYLCYKDFLSVPWGDLEEVKGELEKWRDENARGGER